MSDKILVITSNGCRGDFGDVTIGCIVLASIQPQIDAHLGTYQDDIYGINYPGAVSRYWNRNPGTDYSGVVLEKYVPG